MWEPRLDGNAPPKPRREKNVVDLSINKHSVCGGIKPVHPVTNRQKPLPPELLILNRFGIGYPFLKAANRLASTYQMDAREILLKSGVISEEIWLESQCLLEQERANVRARYNGDTLKLDLAVNNLHRTLPKYSAHLTFTGWQTSLVILAIIGVASLVYLDLKVGFFIIIMLISSFYTSVIALRALMLARYDKRVRKAQTLPVFHPTELPTYSVVVALYKEANQIRQLTDHLAKLNWPKNKLEIKLICEADDAETIAEIKRQALPEYFHLVIVPNAQPKTKPKALNYALSDCVGEYLVIYDAEDRPSPNQLREAYARFLSEDDTLACLQAPLIISNAKQNWLTELFFIEYLTLFKGMLPVLASWNLPLPLGGTSNHFKTTILKSVGAWDPYNVTEDADLGIRLVREGYRSSTISLPTFEEAPPHLVPWVKQRTRWMKGWMQTILVHNRNPIRLFFDMGLKKGLVFHLLLTSIIISSLFHPVLIGLTILQIANPGSIAYYDWFLVLGVYNLVAGYTTYCLFAALVLKSNKYPTRWAALFTIPIYWFLISIAGWRALVHLIVMPHRWEKTPHGLASTKN